MQSDNSIIKVLFKGLSFTSEEVKIIESVFHKVTVKKGSVLLKAGNVVDTKYYVLKGCLRTYQIDSQGKEHTIQFGINDWWISDFTGFFSTEKAIMNIEALKDSTLYKISKKDKEYLYNEVPKIDRYFRIKLEKSFSSFQKRILSNLSQTAKERYLNFIRTYPNIEKSVKNYHIASYLGITTESLSRIRKELL